LVSHAQKGKKDTLSKPKVQADTARVVRQEQPKIQRKSVVEEESNGILSVKRCEGKWKLTLKVFGNEFVMTN
jgi:hypothetical protein